MSTTQTLLALALHVHFLKICVSFYSFYNSTVPCIVEFIDHLLSDEILLAVRGCEREGMGITNGNGNKTWLNLGSVMGMGMNHWKWEGMRLKKTPPLISTANPFIYPAPFRRSSLIVGCLVTVVMLTILRSLVDTGCSSCQRNLH